MGENLNIFFSTDLIKIFEQSLKTKNEFDDDFISPEILLYTILCCHEVEICDLLQKMALEKDKLKKVILKLRKGETINSQSKSIDSESLKKFSTNLTDLAKKGHLDPVIGREKKLEEVFKCFQEEQKIILY